MNKALSSLIGLSLLLWGVCLPAGAEDMIWQPRTPAGGAGTIDPDFYFQMADAAKEGSRNTQIQRDLAARVFKRGFYEIGDDGRFVYYDMNGQRVDLDGVGSIEDDPENPPNGVLYITAPGRVTTY
ncbi:MAG: hypothetical protein SWE60_24485 [Thermodesulfobacteriota bacterium]|nr:hypothetical protein [Thermodesulfobacteriota bacterium]